MSETNDKLALPRKLGFKPIGAAAKLALASKGTAGQSNVNPAELPNRLVLVFDDSGSMSGQPLTDAKAAVGAFLRSCNPSDTAIALYPLCAEKRPLVNDFPLVDLQKELLEATGGTPLYTVLTEAITKEPLTRAIAFSDGSPTDTRLNDDVETKCITAYKEKNIPVDTIFIGSSGDSGYKVLQRLADATGGIFIHFQDTNSLKTGLKYLAPATRALLVNEELKKRIEKGESI